MPYRLLAEFLEIDARLPVRARANSNGAWSSRCESLLDRIDPLDPKLLAASCCIAICNAPLALSIAIAANHPDPKHVLASYGELWFTRVRSMAIDELVSEIFATTNVAIAKSALALREVTP